MRWPPSEDCYVSVCPHIHFLLHDLARCKVFSYTSTSFFHSSTSSHKNDSRNTAVRLKIFGLSGSDRQKSSVFAVSWTVQTSRVFLSHVIMIKNKTNMKHRMSQAILDLFQKLHPLGFLFTSQPDQSSKAQGWKQLPTKWLIIFTSWGKS